MLPQYASEIMPTEIRAAGVASGYFVFNALAVLIAQITPTAIEKIAWRYFLIFLIMDCIFIVIAYVFYPETSNVALESTGEAFGDKVVGFDGIEEAGQGSALNSLVNKEKSEHRSL